MTQISADVAESARAPVTRVQIVASATEAAFDRPLITNVYRSVIAEAMVDAALRPAWTWCSADYAGWDFEHADGSRLEVKQSAARQSWDPPARGRKPAAFDIAPRTGYWQGAVWVPTSTVRLAHIYVFAYHPLLDETADHREPDQWTFFVLPSTALPDAKTIGLNAIAARVAACPFIGLSAAVESARLGLTR